MVVRARVFGRTHYSVVHVVQFFDAKESGRVSGQPLIAASDFNTNAAMR